MGWGPCWKQEVGWPDVEIPGQGRAMSQGKFSMVNLWVREKSADSPLGLFRPVTVGLLCYETDFP